MNGIGQEDNNNKLNSRIKTCFRDDVIFDSDFDSANLAAVVEIPKSEFDYEFNLWTAPDCAGTEFENSNRSWFYFGVRGGSPGGKMLLNLINLNKQVKLFQQGMTPVYRQRAGWERMKERPTFEMSDWGMKLSFFHIIPTSSKLTTYYAFCYPHSYTDCQRRLDRIGNTLDKPEYQHIYYNRELMNLSLDGRRIDLITISSYSGITGEREPRLDGLFPLDEPRAKIFQGKKVYVLSSRVHPGEVPSSHIFNGFLDFILNPEDLRAKILRDKFVFKLVPMLNPDGVARGHYRMDQRGANLNRYYLDPDPSLHPSIFALRSLILHHHDRGMLLAKSSINDRTVRKTSELPLVHFRLDTRDSPSPPSQPDPLTTQEQSGIAVFVDLHAHASKRGCFIYGNHFDDVTVQTENMLYPKLISLNSPNFDFGYCVFTEKNMYWKEKRDGLSKEGSGRVGIYKATGIIRSYTLECNYNTGRLCNTISSADPTGRSTPPHNLNYPPKFTIPVLEELGKSVAISALDLYDCNPWSRIKKSQYSTIHGVRQSITEQITCSRMSRDQSSSSVNSCNQRSWDNKTKISRNGLHSYNNTAEVEDRLARISPLIHYKSNNTTSRSSSRALATPCIPMASHVAKQMPIKQAFGEMTKSSLLISKSKLSSIPVESSTQNNVISDAKHKLSNQSSYKQFEIRSVIRRVSDGERPVSEAAQTAKRGLVGRKEKAHSSRGGTSRALRSFSDKVVDVSPQKPTSLVIGLDLATLFPIDCCMSGHTPTTPPGYLSASPVKTLSNNLRMKQGEIIVKERRKYEQNILPIEGIEGKEFVDRHFSSEEIKLVKRLPKTLQDRALKCLKEQKIISESRKKIEKNLESNSQTKLSSKSDKLKNGFFTVWASESDKKSSRIKSKIRKSDFSPLGTIQPMATRLPKTSKSNPGKKKIYNKHTSLV